MRIAVLADVHGNLPALRAVLGELDAERFDAIVVAGDVVAGPQVAEVLSVLAERTEPSYWVSGNAEREVVLALDGEVIEDEESARDAEWGAAAIGQGWRDRLASWPISLVLDGVC